MNNHNNNLDMYNMLRIMLVSTKSTLGMITTLLQACGAARCPAAAAGAGAADG